MILSSVVIVGGLGAGTLGVVKYRENKRKKEFPWTVTAERMAKNQLVPGKRKKAKRASPLLIAASLAALTKSLRDVRKKLSLFSSDLRSQELKELSSAPVEVSASGHRLSLFHKLLAPLQEQREQLQQIAGQKIEKSAKEKRMERNLVVASVDIGIAAMSLFYPPLIFLTIPGVLYTCIPYYQFSYQAFKEGRLSSYMLDAILEGGMLLGGFFYAAVVENWLATTGILLLVKSENNSKQSLMNLFSNQPRTVFVVSDDGVEVEIPFESLQVDDIIKISAGQMIPIDGIITAGSASIDQHKLTGESQLAEKGVGEAVLASTVVLAGRIYIQTKKTGKQTVAMQLGDILNQTADFKNSIQSRGEALADRLTLPTIGLSLLFLPFLGLSSALAVFTNMFGYKMRVFGPASMLSFLNIASQEGILIKDGRSLELLGEIDTIVFDKTGTLTLEVPTVGQIHTCHGVSESEILKYAAAAEEGQSHPIAKAILAHAALSEVEWPKSLNARYEVGYGILVDLPDRVIHVGSHKFMAMKGITIPPEIAKALQDCHQQGETMVMVAFDEQLVGAIELQATIRPESKQIIDELRERGMSIVIISGDHEAPTKKLAQTLGVDDYFANTLPENKAELVEKLQNEGKSVCFVGDGINDSIALKKANVSVSLRGATTIATDSAQIVLMDGTLNQLCQMFDLVQDFEANMKNNLLLSTIPSATCIAGIVLFHWGVFTGVLITTGTLFVGIGNSIWPLLKHQKNESRE